MSEIKLAEFARTETGLIYQEADGSRRNIVGVVPSSMQGYQGFFQMRKIGLWKPRNIFLACYLSSDDSISVVVDNRRFSISSSRDEISIEVQQKIPLHRRATLNIQGEAMRFSYWWPGNQTWPDDGDILSFIQRSAALPVKRTEFISSWTRKRE